MNCYLNYQSNKKVNIFFRHRKSKKITSFVLVLKKILKSVLPKPKNKSKKRRAYELVQRELGTDRRKENFQDDDDDDDDDGKL